MKVHLLTILAPRKAARLSPAGLLTKAFAFFVLLASSQGSFFPIGSEDAAGDASHSNSQSSLARQEPVRKWTAASWPGADSFGPIFREEEGRVHSEAAASSFNPQVLRRHSENGWFASTPDVSQQDADDDTHAVEVWASSALCPELAADSAALIKRP